MKGAIVLTTMLYCMLNIAYALQISEIMAKPTTDESLNEWIELYNDGTESINVAGYMLSDEKDNDTLETDALIPPKGFAIITDAETNVYSTFNVTEDAVRISVHDKAIGNGLSNSGETFFLYNTNGSLVDSITYDSAEEGFSWTVVDGVLEKTIPSPGSGITGAEPIGEETSETFENTTQETAQPEETEPEQEETAVCDYEVLVILDETTFHDSSDVSFKVKATNNADEITMVTVRATIKTKDGYIVKEYKPFTNQRVAQQRTSSLYKPSLEAGKSYDIEATVQPDCTDLHAENNVASQRITINAAPEEPSETEVEAALTISKKPFAYTLMQYNESVVTNVPFKTIIQLENNGEEMMSVSVWSYLYRGPKSYSGERRENMQTIMLHPHTIKNVTLQNIAIAEPETYKFKVVINKNNQKTNKEIVKDIVVTEEKEAEQAHHVLAEKDAPRNTTSTIITAHVAADQEPLYESSSAKTQKYAVYIFLFFSIALNTFFILRNYK